MANDFNKKMPSESAHNVSAEISIVSAVYNEEECVEELVDRIYKALCGLNVSFEIIIVDDGSRDSTLARLIEMTRRYPQLRAIELLRNFGVMAAITAGLATATGQAIMVIDGDLQDPPELISEFYKKWKNGADVVYGLRTEREESWLLRLLISVFYWMQSRLADIDIPTQSGNFGLIDRCVLDTILAMPERNRFFAGLRSWVGGRQERVEYHRAARARGQTRQGLRGLLRHARLGIISFSQTPLRITSFLSLVIAFVFLSIGLAAVVIRLFTDLAIPGWATFTGLIGAMGFAQSLALSVIAEYLAAIFEEIKARPIYLVRSEHRDGSKIESLHSFGSKH